MGCPGNNSVSNCGNNNSTITGSGYLDTDVIDPVLFPNPQLNQNFRNFSFIFPSQQKLSLPQAKMGWFDGASESGRSHSSRHHSSTHSHSGKKRHSTFRSTHHKNSSGLLGSVVGSTSPNPATATASVPEVAPEARRAFSAAATQKTIRAGEVFSASIPAPRPTTSVPRAQLLEKYLPETASTAARSHLLHETPPGESLHASHHASDNRWCARRLVEEIRG
ncbi:hypothetical protein DID88_006386 [Monilinia fructigena]|uniref:Uncharacterized protein n=1 Tax=Monilinia fructigena TaxID=38457 RepID=A0A395IDE4_9HELO|nr:hypothetical protein DID88_006386 [Monilinia fructigena]